MVRIAICEDSRQEAEALRTYLERYQAQRPGRRLYTEIYADAEAMLAAHTAGSRFDLYLLDILLPGTDGMALAKKLRQAYGKAAVIFITNSAEFALEAYSVRAVNYLLKPVDAEKLFAALDDVLEMLGRQLDVYTAVPTPQTEQMVKLADITYVEVTGHRLCYHLTGGRKLASKVLRIAFEEAARELLEDGRFLRPHRSFLVNAEHVHRLTRDNVIMEDDAHIPVSRLRFPEIRAQYMQYLGQGHA